jgi:division protein CdvB (Snf7/Vps24/ESCRT-III family)
MFMPTLMTANEYAEFLIEHFKSIATAAPEMNLHKIFSGARRAVPNWIDPEEKKIVEEAYAIAEKELFQGNQK